MVRFLQRFTSGGWIGLLAVVLSFGGGCGRKPETRVDESVATVGGTSIQLADLREEMARRLARGAVVSPAEILDELILRESLVARARALGLPDDPELVLAWKRLLIAELKKRELEPRLKEAKADAESLSQPTAEAPDEAAAGRRIPQIHLAVLRQGFHAHTPEAKRQRLRESLEEARRRTARLPPDLADFGALAVEFSDDQATRYQGGDLGWLGENGQGLALDPRVFAAGLALRVVGEISPVTEGTDGYYLVRYLGRRMVAAGGRVVAAKDGVAAGAVDARVAWRLRERIEKEYENEARSRAAVVIKPEWERRLRGTDQDEADTRGVPPSPAGPRR